MPMSSIIVGIDLVPIKPIRGVITLTEDITTDRCRAAIKKVLPPNGRFDVVVCDGAPNVGGAWSAEAYTQAALILEACRLATDFLAPKGLFLTKVFRSPEYHALLYAFHQLFERVESTKPLASRATSAEIYVACHGFRAPGKLDRRLLDPSCLFASVESGGGEDGVGEDVLQRKDGEHKRNRGGYDSASGVLFKSADAGEAFIDSERPAEALGAWNELKIAAGGELDRHPATGEEVRLACQDLRVLGKKDFRALLKWRDAVRRSRAVAAKAAAAAAEAEEGGPAAAAAAAADGDGGEEGEEALMAEMEALQARAEARRRREKKAKAKAKTKARVRSAMGAAGGSDPKGDVYGTDAELFALKRVTGGAAGLQRVADGSDGSDESDGGADVRALLAAESGSEDSDGCAHRGDQDGDVDSEADERQLEAELDRMYEAYAARRGASARSLAGPQRRTRAKLGDAAALPGSDEEEDGGQEGDWDASGERLAQRSAAARAQAQAQRNPLVVAPRAPAAGVSPADAWFSNPVFDEPEDADAGAPGDEDEDEDEDDGPAPAPAPAMKRKRAVGSRGYEEDDDDDEAIRAAARAATKGWDKAGEEEEEEGGAVPQAPARKAQQAGKRSGTQHPGFEVVPAPADASDSDSDASDSVDRELDETLDEDAKAEIRAYGKLFLHRKGRDAVAEAGYHKWAWGGEDDVPPWFEADESRHCRPSLPITAAEAAAERQAMRALDARPIKKVAEARARKKRRLQMRLEQARTQANAIADQEDVPLASRMRQIERVYAKSARKGSGKKGDGKGAKKGDKKAGGKSGGPKLDARQRKDKRQVNSKAKAATAKKAKQKSKQKNGKGGRGNKG